MRYLIIGLSVLMLTANSVRAEVNFGVSIGINVPTYPGLVRVPGYPVYYDPRANANYFFYDGLYWIYQDDNWYASSWYNGPWELTGPESVPLFVLRIPVRYYRQPPAYFHGWATDAPPHWGEHWGPGWEGQRKGWDQWDHRVSPRPAPLPAYQRQYSNERYPPEAEQQHSIRTEHYNYKPREALTQQHFQPKAISTDNHPREAPMQSPMQQRPATQGPRDQPSRAHQNLERPQQPASHAVQQSVQPQLQPSKSAQPQQPMSRTQGEPQVKDHDYKDSQQLKGRDNQDEGHGHDRK